MEAKNRNIQGLYILFYIFRVVNMKENYDGFTVTSPNGINTPFWTALTEVLEVEPWTETITIKENSIISAGDLDK